MIRRRAQRAAQRPQLFALAPAGVAALDMLLDAPRIRRGQFVIGIRIEERPSFVTVHPASP
jgi:hypothetical protein